MDILQYTASQATIYFLSYDMILLDGKTVSNNIKSELKDWCSQHMTGQDSIVIFLLTDHPSSTTYVRMKQQFGKDI
jgi:5,10-methylene-tetrahydrofolate dehydrogenase/methenyl tetrahydrofolate cyclohydrolase